MVQPVPTDLSTFKENNIKNKEGGTSHRLRLFTRGNLISGLFLIIGKNQFPNPPIRMGITMKKIIRKACMVTKEL